MNTAFSHAAMMLYDSALVRAKHGEFEDIAVVRSPNALTTVHSGNREHFKSIVEGNNSHWQEI
ncbi:MAG: hypothetical protein ACLFR0_06545, partial [Alphaproteobacteria bacterium]